MTNSSSVDALYANNDIVPPDRASRRAVIDKLVCELTSVLDIAVSHHTAGSSLPVAELVSEVAGLTSTLAAADDYSLAAAVEHAARFLASLERMRRGLVATRHSSV